MAGPSLSHILESPRIPTSNSGGGSGGGGLERYTTLPSIATRDEPLQRNHTYPNLNSSRIPSTTASVGFSSLGATVGPGRGLALTPQPTTTTTTTLPSLTAHHAHHEHQLQHQPRSRQSIGRVDILPAPVSTSAPLAHQSPALAPAAPTTNATPASQNASQSNHRGNNLYACRDCGRSYSRPEHLVRHVQTHTLGRRFVCDICQKSFARKDLLRRHVANHDNDSPKKRRRTTTSPGAGRVSHACRSCAIARVKCDDAKPCKRCLSRNLNCVSTETPSTAAMHLLHLSASSSSSPSGPAATTARATPPANHNDGDKSVTTAQSSHSTASTRDSNSPAPPYLSSSHQPRSVTLPAPHSLGLDAAHDRSNTNLPQPFAKLAIQEPRSPDYHLPPIEFEPSTSAMDPNRLPYFDFLRDVLQDGTSDSGSQGQGLLVLDFCDYEKLEFTVEDLSHSEDVLQSRVRLVKAWADLSSRGLPAISSQAETLREDVEKFENVVPGTLSQSCRDRVLAIVLDAGRANSSMQPLAGSFPTLDVMDFLVHRFLASIANQPYEWVHLPTFRLRSQSPEWAAIAAATAAVSSPIPSLRNFGFALQEAVRASITSQLEENNSAMQDIALFQTLIMAQDIGLWSGNKRKMEIAECYLATPVKMLRHRRKFQASHYAALLADASDDGTVLEDKWRKWVDKEKWKRLVFHCFVRDAQCSMATLTNPTMSYAELALPLPEARDLWVAATAAEWKAACLQSNADRLGKIPSVGDLIQDCQLLRSKYWQLDVPFSLSIYLHGYWALILEHGQLSTIHRSRPGSGGTVGGNQGLLLGSRHQELVKELQSFHLMSAEWPDMSYQDHMLLNLLLMNLHVSLDDIQLFAGKEGEEEARRALTALQHWATTTEARSSIWYAGQVLRYARSMAPGRLKDFYAIAVHHAALVLWAYGVVTTASRRHRSVSPQQSAETILLDDLESNSFVQKFIGFGHGRPAIRDIRGSTTVSESAIEDPKGCLMIIQEVLRANFCDAAGVPAVVNNLCQVLKQLGDATWAVGLGS